MTDSAIAKRYLSYPMAGDLDQLQFADQSIYCITPHYYNFIVCQKIKQYYGEESELKESESKEGQQKGTNPCQVTRITVLDLTAGIGSDTIGFAQQFHHVTAIESNVNTFKALENNVCNVFKLKNFKLICSDSEIIASELLQKRQPHVVYLDPGCELTTKFESSNFKHVDKFQPTKSTRGDSTNTLNKTLKLGTRTMLQWIQVIHTHSAESLIVIKLPSSYNLSEFSTLKNKVCKLQFQPFTVVFISPLCDSLPKKMLKPTQVNPSTVKGNQLKQNHSTGNASEEAQQNNHICKYHNLVSDQQIYHLMYHSSSTAFKLVSLFVKMLFRHSLDGDVAKIKHEIDCFLWRTYLKSEKQGGKKMLDSDVYAYFNKLVKVEKTAVNKLEVNKPQDATESTANKVLKTDIAPLKIETSLLNTTRLSTNEAHGREQKRAVEIYEMTKAEYPPFNSPASMLDFGAFDGFMCEYLGELFKIPVQRRFAADIDNWFGTESVVKSQQVQFISLNETKTVLPLETNSVDVVTCLQVLHHVKNLDSALAEIARVCKKTLVLREHDCMNAETSMLIDIEHSIWERVLKSKGEEKECTHSEKEEDIEMKTDEMQTDDETKSAKPTENDFVSTYYGQYRSKFEWTNLLRKYGFEYNKKVMYPTPTHPMKNLTRYYYAVYTKVK